MPGDPIGEVRSARRLFRLADAAKALRSLLPVVAGREGALRGRGSGSPP
jgi:hypothetical protein